MPVGMVHKNIKEMYGGGGYQVNFKMTQPKSSNPPQPPLPPPPSPLHR